MSFYILSQLHKSAGRVVRGELTKNLRKEFIVLKDLIIYIRLKLSYSKILV